MDDEDIYQENFPCINEPIYEDAEMPTVYIKLPAAPNISKIAKKHRVLSFKNNEGFGLAFRGLDNHLYIYFCNLNAVSGETL